MVALRGHSNLEEVIVGPMWDDQITDKMVESGLLAKTFSSIDAYIPRSAYPDARSPPPALFGTANPARRFPCPHSFAKMATAGEWGQRNGLAATNQPKWPCKGRDRLKYLARCISIAAIAGFLSSGSGVWAVEIQQEVDAWHISTETHASESSLATTGEASHAPGAIAAPEPAVTSFGTEDG